MKEYPIIFTSEMVRALLDGRKTMTRRVLKKQPIRGVRECHWVKSGFAYECESFEACSCREIKCPYGKIGSRLWVRETWAEMCKVADDFSCCLPDSKIDEIHHKEEHHYFEYKADTGDKYPGGWPEEEAKENPDVPRWKSPIFMPRNCSRITLEITNIRVERLQDITEEDARAEGVFERRNEIGDSGWGGQPDPLNEIPNHYKFKWAFKELWQSIKGEGSWDLNPWVWVIEFRKQNQ